MSITLCVLLWPHPNGENELIRYESRLLGLLTDHGGRVIERVRAINSGGTNNDQPFECHLIEFESESGLSRYLVDERRVAMTDEHDDAIARTQVFRVDRV